MSFHICHPHMYNMFGKDGCMQCGLTQSSCLARAGPEPGKVIGTGQGKILEHLSHALMIIYPKSAKGTKYPCFGSERPSGMALVGLGARK